jgi:hypothetical protein
MPHENGSAVPCAPVVLTIYGNGHAARCITAVALIIAKVLMTIFGLWTGMPPLLAQRVVRTLTESIVSSETMSDFRRYKHS